MPHMTTYGAQVDQKWTGSGSVRPSQTLPHALHARDLQAQGKQFLLMWFNLIKNVTLGPYNVTTTL